MPWKLSSGLKNSLLGDNGLKKTLASGQIRIFSGAQPPNADAAEQGALLCVVTLASGAMTSGTSTNGLVFDSPTGGKLGKPVSAVWSGVNVANGTAGWFRWYPNDFDNHVGADTDGTKIRVDGSCSTGSGQMNLVSLNLKSGVTTTIDNVLLSI